MHAHACLNLLMRTTIEIPDDLRAKLLELAAKRGQKGFSEIVSEAIRKLLHVETQMDKIRRHAISLKGKLTKTEAESLKEYCQEIRQSWRS